MDILVPAVNAIVVAASALVVMWVGKERMDQRFGDFEKRMDQRFDAVDRRFEGVDKQFEQLRAEMATMRSDMATMRSDLTHVALAVGARPQPNAG